MGWPWAAAVAAMALGGGQPALEVSVEAEVYQVLAERIEVRPGTSVSSVTEVLTLARLSLDSAPRGAHVTLDGEARGQTPLSIEDLPLGAHDLVVKDTAHSPFHRRLQVDPPR
jgi:hypothetical protein